MMNLNNTNQVNTPQNAGQGNVEQIQQGHVGEWAVQVEEGGQPQVAEARTFGQKVEALFNRVIATLSGAERRAVPEAYGDMNQNERQALHDRIGGQADRALDALARGDGERVRVGDAVRALTRMADAAGPLRHEAGGTAVLRDVITAVVDGIPPEACVAAMRGIDSDRGGHILGRLADNAEATQALLMLHQALAVKVGTEGQQAAQASASARLTTALASDPDDPQAAARARDGFNAARNDIRVHYDRMVTLNIKPNSADMRDAFLAGEMLGVIAGTSDDIAEPVDTRLLKSLDTDTLRTLHTKGRAGADSQTKQAALEQVGLELQSRMEDLTASLPELVDRVMSIPNDQSVDAAVVTTLLGEAVDVVAAGRKFADRSGLDASLFADAGRRLADHMDQLVKAGNLNLDDVSDAVLHRLEMALKGVGSDVAGAVITNMADARRDTLRGEYHAVLDHILDAVRADDLSGLLQITRDSGSVRDSVAAALEPLGLKLEGADDTMAARSMLIDTRLATLETDDLLDILGVLERQDVRALAGGLCEVSYDLLETNVEMFRDTFNLGSDLMMLRGTVKEQLQERGVLLPPRPDAKIPDGLMNMNQRGFSVLRDSLGIEANATGMTRMISGTPTGHAVEMFEAGATERPDTKTQTTRGIIGGVTVDVCEQYLLDVNRASYAANGQPLMNLNAWALEDSTQGRDAMMMEGVERLLESLGGDADLAFAVSQYANQSTLAPLMPLTMGLDSVIRLQDGTQGSIVGRDQSTTYDIERTEDGEARIRFSFQTGGDRLMDADGRFHWLEPGHRDAHFSFELTVDREGGARMSQPLRFDLNVQGDTQWSDDFPYARPDPQNAREALQEGRYPGLRHELREFAVSRLAEENIDFYSAVEDYRNNPTPQAAQDLFDTFVVPDAPRQVNLGNAAVDAVRTALLADPSAPDAFEGAIPDTLHNISDTLQKFVAFKQESMQ
jgi:hypothetical protein